MVHLANASAASHVRKMEVRLNRQGYTAAYALLAHDVESVLLEHRKAFEVADLAGPTAFDQQGQVRNWIFCPETDCRHPERPT